MGEKEGKIKSGDEITMVSATFGDEMWSARNVGKYRLEKSIAVRQGMYISFVVENSSDKSKKAREAEVKRQQAEKDKTTRLQKQLAQEVELEKEKGSFFRRILLSRAISVGLARWQSTCNRSSSICYLSADSGGGTAPRHVSVHSHPLLPLRRAPTVGPVAIVFFHGIVYHLMSFLEGRAANNCAYKWPTEQYFHRSRL